MGGEIKRPFRRTERLPFKKDYILGPYVICAYGGNEGFIYKRVGAPNEDFTRVHVGESLRVGLFTKVEGN